MFCQKCGSVLNDDIQFCTTCGARTYPQQSDTPPMQFDNQNSQHNAQNQANMNYNNQKAQPPKKKGSSALIIGLVVGIVVIVVVALLFGVGAFFIGRQTGKNKLWDEITSTQQVEETTEEETTAEKFVTNPAPHTTSPAASQMVYPDFYYESDIYYVEPKEGINLRYGPGTNHDRICGIPQGQQIEIVGGSNLDPDRNWVYVYYEKKSTYGWVSTEYISFNYVPTSPNTVSPYSINYYSDYDMYYAYVTPSAGLNVRSGPGTGYSKSGSMAQGDTFLVLGISAYDSRWVYILYDDYSYGFVHRDYIRAY